MLAVMVDLGWSWWVTTLIAACVALLAALAFVRTRRATIRTVAAVVLFEAIAIGIVAPFVMKSNKSTSGTSAMSSGSSGGADFAQKADGNCSALNSYVATLGNPKTPAGIERQMDQLLPAFWRKIVAQGELAVPPDKQPTARKWMHAMAAVGGDYEALRAAAARRDAAAMGRANSSAGAHATDAARLSKELGMHVCFQ
jgi:hypothetical protein